MIFKTDIKVRGNQCDAYGHINNARWVELLEEARWRWLDEDVDLDQWTAKKQGLVVLNLEVSYRRPAFPNEVLEFHCWYTKIGGRGSVCRQAVFRKATGEKLLEAQISFVLLNVATGKPLPLEGDVRAASEKYMHPEIER